MIRDTIPPVSPEVEEAYDRVFRAIKEITTPSRMPKARTFESFMEDLRAKGYNDIFTTENPGP